MVNGDVRLKLYEDGDWRDHTIPEETVPSILQDLMEQCEDTVYARLYVILTPHQREALDAARKAETQSRERGASRPAKTQDVINLIGD